MMGPVRASIACTAVADVMLHGRPGGPDPEIAAWLAANGASRRSQPGPHPRPGQARGLTVVLPTLIWPGWALRLMPPEGFNFLSYQVGLTVMLAVAVTGAPDCRTARGLIGLHPAHPGDLATFTSRLRKHGVLEPVTAAI
ncbi:MAG TPA: hypothetical protein VFQ68_29670 [Streptosporangiaceae bacterium]|nr:hypothetical protein [Streptosporangiaceae bacterium]